MAPMRGWRRSWSTPCPADVFVCAGASKAGTTKEMIHEKFGDGIMSAIDFDMTLERRPDQKGDRIKMTISGKFLLYKRY